jgi:hypothetical protein
MNIKQFDYTTIKPISAPIEPQKQGIDDKYTPYPMVSRAYCQGGKSSQRTT